MKNNFKTGDQVIFTGNYENLTSFIKVYTVIDTKVWWVTVKMDNNIINGFNYRYFIKAIEIK